MPQIPVFNPSQRLEPGSPVSIGSSESARDTGEAIGFFGKALQNLGDMLDDAGRKSKAEVDRISIKTSVNDAREQAAAIRAEMAVAPVLDTDKASGMDGVSRFNEALKPRLDEIAAKLPSEKERRVFMADVGEDLLKERSLVLAGEVSKREKLVPIKMQEAVNGYAKLSRTDPNLTAENLSKAELDIRNSTYFSPAMKEELVQKARTQIATEAINGRIEARDFKGAHSMLKQHAEIFADGEDKMGKTITKAEHDYETNEWTKAQRGEVLSKRATEAAQSKAVSMYTAELAAAGSDQNKIDVIHQKIQMDPKLDGPTQQRLTSVDTFSKVADKKYEASVTDKIFAEGANLDLVYYQVGRDFQAGKISAAANERIKENIARNKSYADRFPSLRSTVAEYGDKLKSFSSSTPTNNIAGSVTPANDPKNVAAYTEYMEKVSALQSSGKYSEEGVRQIYADILGKNYAVDVNVKIPGLENKPLNNVSDIDKELAGLAKQYLSDKDTMSPEARKNFLQTIEGAKARKKAMENAERAKAETLMPAKGEK